MEFYFIEQAIKDLQEIQKEHPGAIMCKTTSNFEQGNNTVPCTGKFRFFNGNVRKESFRDAFEGNNYNADVVRIGGEQTFVQL